MDGKKSVPNEPPKLLKARGPKRSRRMQMQPRPNEVAGEQNPLERVRAAEVAGASGAALGAAGAGAGVVWASTGAARKADATRA